VSEIPSPNGYSLRCPRDAGHVVFVGIATMRVRRSVTLDAAGRSVRHLDVLATEILREPLDGPPPTCAACGCEAMLGRPPISVIDEEIEF